MKTERNHRNPAGGFTLVELLVVIAIVAVLASLAFLLGSRSLKSARVAVEIANLRQAGEALTVVAVDKGYYPMGWNVNRGLSWAGLILQEMNGPDSKTKQAEFLWSPVLKVKVPPDDPIETVTHFTANPAIMTDVANNSKTTPKPPKFTIRPTMLFRPSEQILLAAVVPRSLGDKYKRGHAMSWAMRPLVGGNGGSGNPPSRNPANSEIPIKFPDDVKELTSGSLPDFNRYGDGKGRFFFVDGHVQVMEPGEHKQKHWAVSY